jgi:hypothetical protein
VAGKRYVITEIVLRITAYIRWQNLAFILVNIVGHDMSESGFV